MDSFEGGGTVRKCVLTTSVSLAVLITASISSGAFPIGILSAQQLAVARSTGDSPRREELLSHHVTLTLQDVSLKRAIDSLARVANVVVQYKVSTIVGYTTPVTVHVKNVPLGEVLEHLLSGTGLRVAFDQQGALAIIAAPRDETDSIPGNGTIAGRVLDSTSGKGIGGATIKVQGTKLSAMSSDSGRFTIRDVPRGNQVITVRLFGRRPVIEQVAVTTNEVTIVRVLTVSVPNVLSGVVTTATGVQRKIEVGSDITTLNADSVRQVAPISSVTDLLATRVPGLTVVHSSGTPGDPARLRLRGAGSVQLNNDPIVIVDGIRVYASQSDRRNANLAPTESANPSSNTYGGAAFNAPSPLDQIDPNNIATIEVLKGPSASAIYGSDAASGVIVITTKKGQSGPARWSTDLATGVNWLPGDWPTNYYRFGYDDFGRGPLCPWYDVSCDVDSLVPFQALNNPQYTVFAHGNEQQANLTVSGGVPTLTYNVTGSTQATLGNLKLPGSEVQRYDSLYGQIPHTLARPDRYTTWGVTGSLTASPRPTLTATLQSSLFNSIQRRSNLDGAITQLAGEYLGSSRIASSLLQHEYERVTDDRATTTNSVSLQWQPRPWLPLTATSGINNMQRNDVAYVPFGVYDQGDFSQCADNLHCGDTTGVYGLGRGTSRVTTVTVGTQMPTLRNTILVALGGNFYSTSTADFQVYTNQLAPGVTTPTTFTATCQDGTQGCYSPTIQSTSSQSTYGWYLEPRLNVASRFFAAPGFRLDGGSGGAKNSSLGGLSGFPKMDLSYVAVDRQDADRPLWGVISLLRPRLAFGYAGTQPTPQDKLRLYNIGSYQIAAPGGAGVLTGLGGCDPLVTLDGVTEVPAVCLAALGNTELRPERSSELEGGFDATLWNGRISLTYSQYNKTRHDAIIPIPVAQSVFSDGHDVISIQKNIGVVRNTGTELTVTATPVQSRLLGWTIGASFSKNDNVVVRLNKGQLPIVLGANGGTGAAYGNGLETRVQAGYPLFGEFARPILGSRDANGDNVIQPSEIRYGDSAVYVGQPEPKYQLNLTQDLALLNGQLSLHMNFAYQHGLTQLNQGSCGSYNSPFLLLPNTPNTPLATQTAVVAAGCGGTETGVTAQSVIGLVQIVNTFRFQSMSVNYVVPKRVASWVHAPRATIALQGNNLGLHTNYRGKDPDVNAFSTVSAGDATVDTGQLPEPRSVLLRITVGN